MGIQGHHMPIWYDEATPPADGQIVVWDAVLGRWKAAPVDISALDTGGLATDADLTAGLATKQDTIPTGTYVDTTTAQVVGGAKEFSADFHVGSGRPWVDPRSKQDTGYGAVGDGVSRPLSTLYASLEAAQAAFPQAAALTDELDAVAFLRAQAISPKMRVDDGEFVVNLPIDFHTAGNTQGLIFEGAGREETIFDSRVASAALFRVDGSGTGIGADTYKSQKGGHLSGFKVTTTLVGGARPASSDGIAIKANFFEGIEDVSIDGITGHGLVFDNPLGDSDSNSFVFARQFEVTRCGGNGVHVPDPTPGNIGTGHILLENFLLSQNLGLGARILGQKWTLRHGSIAYNVLGGVITPYVSGVPASQFIWLDQIEADQNGLFNVHLENCRWGKVHNTRSIHRDGLTGVLLVGPPVGIRLGTAGGSGYCEDTEIKDISLRQDSGSAVTLLDITNTAYRTRFRGIRNVGTVTATLVADLGVETVWPELLVQPPVRSTVTAASYGTLTPRTTPAGTVTTGGVWSTPGGENYIYTFTGASATGTIGNPAKAGHTSFPVDGQKLELTLRNSTGGAMGATSWGTHWKHVIGAGVGEFANPANGFERSAHFRWDSGTARWRIIGGWSGDVAV